MFGRCGRDPCVALGYAGQAAHAALFAVRVMANFALPGVVGCGLTGDMGMTITRYGKMGPLLLPVLAMAGVAAALPGSAPDHRRLVLSPGVFAEGACVADVDGDGALDLVAGPFVYRGPDLKESYRFRPGEASSPNGYGHD